MATTTKVWCVWRHDYEYDSVEAAYDTEALARDHADRTGGDVEELDILSALDSEVAKIDREAVIAERAAKDEKSRRQRQEHSEREARSDERIKTLVIADISGPTLCSCDTFSIEPMLRTEHGYCRYCGGWRHDVFRAHMGDEATVRAICKLEEYRRVKMFDICGLAPVAIP